MPRPHSPERMQAAVAEYERGVKGPVVCRRHGISERTLYRWLRVVARARAEAATPAREQAGLDQAFQLAALRVIAGELDGAQRESAARKLRSTLNMSAEGAARLLGLADEDERTITRRVGMATPYRRGDAPLAPAFGKAKWLAVASAPHRFRFFRNAGRTGVAMADVVRAADCTDLVALELGERTRERLESHGTRLWQGLAGVSLADHVALLEGGKLQPVPGALVTLGRGAPGVTAR